MHHFERAVMLQNVDSHWREHLSALDHLRQGIHLRGYAQKNPKQEYKREAFELFSGMLGAIKQEVTQITTTVNIQASSDVEALDTPPELSNVEYSHADAEALVDEAAPLVVAADPQYANVGRNDACPCGSGKKFKHCHGRLA